MRKHYIDNVRILCILMLFPFHSAYIFNNLNEAFYINGTPSEVLTTIDLAVYPWWMSGLFVLAGISAMYSLTKRSTKEFALERVKRLFIPFLVAIAIIIPPQSYIADIFHNGYKGNIFSHYKEFFTITDFTGYDGHFTPGNAWFILFLFVYSIIFLPLFSWYAKKENKLNCSKIKFPVLLLIGIIIALSNSILSIGGKSLLQFALCFCFGFFIASNESVQEELEKQSTFLLISWIIFMILREVVHAKYELWNSPLSYIAYYGVTCFGILGLIGCGKKFLDKEYFFTKYLAQAEFALFLTHQTFVVITGFYVLKFVNSPYIASIIITLISILLTFGFYEICKRNKITRFLLSIKIPNTEHL